MSTQLVEYRSGTETFLVEAEAPPSVGEFPAGIFSRDKNDPPPDFSSRLQSIRPAVEDALREFSQLSIKPTEIELEIGIKFVGEAGVIVAKASTEANLVLKLKWTPGA